MTTPQPEALTQFDYLLNVFEQASQADKPAEHCYGLKRRELYAYVRELEGMRKLAADRLEQMEVDRKQALEWRKDAVRYRWLRSRLPGSAYRIAGVIYSEGGTGVDAAIDAAMLAQGEKEPSNGRSS